MRRTLTFSILVSLVAGLVGGTVAGVYGDDVIASWKKPVTSVGTMPTTNPESAAVPANPPETSAGEESAVVRAVARVSPAVVSVIISKEITYNTTGSLSPFEDFFGQFGFEVPQAPEQPARREKRDIGGGTGFIITGDGLIVTNKHVADDPQAEYTVVLTDRRRFPAKVLAKDPLIDLAVLKIEAKDLPTVVLGDSSALKIGESVIAIGNTLSQFPNTVTRGIVSGLARRVVAGDGNGQSEVIEEAIQTDAAINPGNSGGPLINLRGEVIGVNVAVSRPAQGVGFAIPVNVAKRVIESVKRTGRIVRPWLGVRYIIIDDAVAERNSLPVTYGALVVRGEERTDLAVIPGSPADKAGLKENDIILEVEGVKLDAEHSLASTVAKHNPGDAVKLKILRQGKEQVLTVTLEEFKGEVQ